jgi:MoxR-like ATPase
MSFTVFQRDQPDKLFAVDLENGADDLRGANYLASEALENTVNVGIALGRPILVSGEPGCGKTELGFAIARKLGIPRLHFFAVKSDSDARSLLYEHDTIGRFHVAQVQRTLGPDDPSKSSAADARKFIEYRALGRAILDAYPGDDVRHLFAGRYKHPGEPQRSVVVIDEIDKAPRDFPNDLLNEIDRFWFRVAELGFGGAEEAPETPQQPIAVENRPIVIITSNTERQLPDAFLRRCVYHHIAFPDSETLSRIVDARLARLGQSLAEEDLRRAFRLIETARRSAFEKLPGTAELIDFVDVLRQRRAQKPDEHWDARFRACTTALAKTEHDITLLEQLLAAETR